MEPPTRNARPKGQAVPKGKALKCNSDESAIVEGDGAGRSTWPDLENWLDDMILSEYSDRASAWAEGMGFCSVDELIWNLDDFAEAMEMTPQEVGRLRKGARKTLQANKHLRNEVGSTGKDARTKGRKSMSEHPHELNSSAATSSFEFRSRGSFQGTNRNSKVQEDELGRFHQQHRDSVRRQEEIEELAECPVGAVCVVT